MDDELDTYTTTSGMVTLALLHTLQYSQAVYGRLTALTDTLVACYTDKLAHTCRRGIRLRQ